MASREKPRHPHADAEYRVYRLDDDRFGIEVSLPEAFPTRITSFPDRVAANRWVANHRKTVEEQSTFARHPQFRRRPGRKPA